MAHHLNRESLGLRQRGARGLGSHGQKKRGELLRVRLATELVGPYPPHRSLGNYLRKLAGVKLAEAQARTRRSRVLEHTWYLSERPGRDVGLEVAALDYFQHIERPLPPARFRLFDWRGLPPRLPMMLP